MRKRIFSMLALVGLALLMNGCTYRGANCKIDEHSYPEDKQLSNIYMVQGSVSSNTPSGGYNVRSKAIHSMQMAAEITHERGYKYFAILLPRNELSVHDGSLINTMQEFVDKCLPDSANIFGHHLRSCGLGSGFVRATLVIAMYNEQQTEFVTFNAQDVLDYIHKNDLYRAGDKPEWKDICTKKELRDIRS